MMKKLTKEEWEVLREQGRDAAVGTLKNVIQISKSNDEMAEGLIVLRCMAINILAQHAFNSKLQHGRHTVEWMSEVMSDLRDEIQMMEADPEDGTYLAPGGDELDATDILKNMPSDKLNS